MLYCHVWVDQMQLPVLSRQERQLYFTASHNLQKPSSPVVTGIDVLTASTCR